MPTAFLALARSYQDLLGDRPEHAQQRFGPVQVGADAGDDGRSWFGWVRLQAFFQDGLDRSVVRVAIGQCPLARGVQAHLAILFAQSDDALALPQVMQLMLVEELVNGRADVLAELAGLLAAP